VFALLPYAGAIALLSFMEATGQARAVTLRNREAVEPSSELVALGCMNVASAFFAGFPAGASYSRTALNLQAGARTQLAGLVSAGVVLVTVQTLTPFLSPLPKAVLAAVVVVAVLSLVDVRLLRRTWRIRHEDGLAAAVTFLVTLLLGIGGGIAAGVLFSLAAFVYRSANPRLVELGRVEGTTLYRNATRFSVHTDPSVLLLRMDGPLYFANAKFLADQVLALVARRPEVKHVLLDSSGMPDVDADGARTLADLDLQIRALGATLHLVTVRGPVRDVLHRAGLSEALLGEERYWATLEEAVAALDLPAESPLRTLSTSERRPSRVF
jgi:SulP family sulfate permease